MVAIAKDDDDNVVLGRLMIMRKWLKRTLASCLAVVSFEDFHELGDKYDKSNKGCTAPGMAMTRSAGR